MLIQVCAGQRDTVVHTVRELMRAVAGHLTIRWTIDGFQTAARDRNPKANTRNLFAGRPWGPGHSGDPLDAHIRLANPRTTKVRAQHPFVNRAAPPPQRGWQIRP